MKRKIKTLSLTFLTLMGIQVCHGQLKPSVLKCENMERPLGVPLKETHFAWELTATKRSEVQAAYQVGMASSEARLALNQFDIWDSGKIISDNSTQVPYMGKKLAPGTLFFWKVRVWDKDQQVSSWSATASFFTGLSAKTDWQNAQWIGYEDLVEITRVAPGIHAPYAHLLKDRALRRPVTPMFRKVFKIRKKVTSAFAFVCGLGQYQMTINGQEADKAFLAPGWTYYDKTCLYNILDVTGLLKNGENAVGIVLGNGFFNINRERYFKLVSAFGMPKLISTIKINYADGTSEFIVSDRSWKTAASPITFNSIYGGENYDARLEQPGWDKSGFNDSRWQRSIIVSEPKGKLVPELDYPVAVMDSFEVASIREHRSKEFVYDLGQNASAIPEITVKGRKGQTIKLVPAEILNKDGLPDQSATGDPYYLSYTLKGQGEEIWRPKFTYYGFRYVLIQGAVPQGQAETDLPEIIRLRSLHIRNSSPLNGSFTCSNPLFNKIYNLINWAIKSNLQSVATDCPHREKLGWLEQDYLMGASIHYNYDNYNLYRKIVNDLIDAQTNEGFVPDIAPEYVKFEDGFLDSPEWGSASVILPWLLYDWYKDTTVLRKAYPMMQKYVRYLESRSDHHVLSYGLGDWFDYGPAAPGEAQLTPKALTATAIYYYDVALLAKMAGLLGLQADSSVLNQQALAIKAAFNRRFYDPIKAIYATGSQTAMAMPLSVGLVDNQYKNAVLKNLCDSITAQGFRLTAGDIGFHFLVDALDKGGRSDIIYKMNDRDDVPGYGYQLKKGATALTESWPALQNVSNNHLMLGHVMEWFYSGIAGINQAENSAGFQVFKIRPQPVGDVTSAEGSFHSPYGWVNVKWVKENNKFLLKVTIPPNTTGHVYLPDYGSNKIFESGIAVRADKIDGSNRVICGSGTYQFEVLTSD